MKQLVILSGKGGTGKTTVASSLIRLSDAKAYADCDVDAPNLHIMERFDTDPKRTESPGLPKAFIIADRCIECGRCQKICRFEAIVKRKNGFFISDSCEGCAVCTLVCPSNAIEMVPFVAGMLFLYKDDRTFSTAELNAGAGATGKLVSQVKVQLKENTDWDGTAVIDGSPGIGCPVIATLAGASMCLMVAEPSISGISDLERAIGIVSKSGVPIAVCVNKFDMNVEKTAEIHSMCIDKKIKFVGKIPYDPNVVDAVNTCTVLVDIDCPAGNAIRSIFLELTDFINEN